MKGQKNVVPFQKSKVASMEKNRKKWSNTLIAIVATAIIIGNGVWDGDAKQLLKGQGATGGSEVTASKQMRKEESKVGGTVEQTPAPKEEKTKAQTGTSLGSNEIIFCSRRNLFF